MLLAGQAMAAGFGGTTPFARGRERRRARRKKRKFDKVQMHRELAEASFGELPESPTLDLSGLPDRYGNVQQPQGPQGPQGSALGYADEAYDWMDVPGVDNQVRTAAMGEVNRGALSEAVGRRQAMQTSGAGGAKSGTALALQMQGNTNLGFNRANVESGLQQDAAARQMAARQGALGFGTNTYGQELDRYGLDMNKYGLDMNKYGMDIDNAGRRSDMDLQKAGLLFEANQLMPWQTKIGRQTQIAQAALGRRAANMQLAGNVTAGATSMVGSVAGGAAGACWVADELWGADDKRTHDARLYASTVNTPFTITYRKHGEQWAAWIREDEVARRLLTPIWDAMAAEGSKIRKSVDA